MIAAFERGDNDDHYDENDDPLIKKYLNEYKKVEDIIGVPEHEEEPPIDDDDEEYFEEEPIEIPIPKNQVQYTQNFYAN